MKNKLILLIIILTITTQLVHFATPQDSHISVASLTCGSTKAPTGGNFTIGFVQEMENLATLINSNRWGTTTVPSLPPLFGLAQCYGHVSQTDCLLCYASIRTKIPTCLPSTSARIYLDGCFLRYDGYLFYNQTVQPDTDTRNCTVQNPVSTSTDVSGFQIAVGRAVANASRVAVSGNGYGTGMSGGGGVLGYAMVQCWNTLSKEGCGVCLGRAWEEAKSCLPGREGRGLMAGCYLKYSDTNFYDPIASSASDTLSPGLISAIVLLSCATLVLAVCAAFTVKKRMSKARQERRNLGKVSSALKKSSFNFKYEMLEKATDYFDESRKLGQGGTGSVYMGTLPDGRTVAVKRLVFNTRQWVDEFFNEVNLIGGIQHKNLVRLLGCSIEGPESLLVYEYVPNNSIDHYVSDKARLQYLNWKQRFNIVSGTAQGLAYLHGGYTTRIIHRDIKGSNVLLDKNLDPKIADFGLARCFGSDKTHLTTGIAGTLGYMAPEYLVRGQLTEKADVYSFGVLALEIICGRKNNVLVQGSTSLLQTVWKLYKSGNLQDAVDPILSGDFPENEVSSVLQVALLCSQASASLRPSMDEVVQMLSREDCEIPLPSQPPFVNGNGMDPFSSLKSSSTNSSVSYARTRAEGCSTSSDSSSLRSLCGASTSKG